MPRLRGLVLTLAVALLAPAFAAAQAATQPKFLGRIMLTTDTAPRYTSPFLRGFEERRKSGFGTFIPEAALRKEENRPFANVIRAHVPSVRVYEVSNLAAVEFHNSATMLPEFNRTGSARGALFLWTRER